MNRINELLVILSEECAEVQQAASKCIRFGMDSEYNGQTNRQRLESELGDFLAMVKLIMAETTLSEEHVMKAAESKLVKVEKYMNNAKKTAPKRKSLKTK
jgi:NTP pyrophosphatase (non-canonical NTP hydrolase)